MAGVTSALYIFGMALCNGLWIYILIGFIALVTVIKIAMGKMTGNIRNQFLDRIMPFSTYKQLTASIFSTTGADVKKRHSAQRCAQHY